MNPEPILRALAFAADKHKDQRRKGVGAPPYINHPIAVAHVLAAEAESADEVTLVAAILHDTVEDTETTLEDLRLQFGKEVAELVDEVTDDKSLPKARRKELQVAHTPHATQRAKRLKLADKICNVRDVTTHPPTGWSDDRRREYVLWTEQVAGGCRGVDAKLEAAFDRAVRAALEALGDAEP